MGNWLGNFLVTKGKIPCARGALCLDGFTKAEAASGDAFCKKCLEYMKQAKPREN